MSVIIDPPQNRPAANDTLLSVVLPVFNEVRILDRLNAAVQSAVARSGCHSEIIYVNDGSSDGSAEALDQMAHCHTNVRVLHLSRNFGHQAAVQAGLEHAQGDAIVVMDSDMQDDPAAIPEFLKQWRAGYDVVYAVRFGRKENAIKRALFAGFYRVLNAVSRTPIPMDAGNFGLVDRRVAREVSSVIDRDRFFPGLRSWVGFRQVGIRVERCRRHDDNPRVSLKGLFRLAKTAIFSFSAAPLTMFYIIAAASLTTCFGLSAFALYHKLITGDAIPGWTSMTIVVSLFGALNALGIGVLGEYAIRIFDQVRARQPFIVARTTSSAPKAAAKPEAEAAVHLQVQELLDWVSQNWAVNGSKRLEAVAVES
jgi:dolichol-phosphate mannosyltransferase